MSIQMNAEQLEAFKRTLNPDPETHKINYPAAYRYIADIVDLLRKSLRSDLKVVQRCDQIEA